MEFYIAKPGRYEIAIDKQNGVVEIEEVPLRDEDPKPTPDVKPDLVLGINFPVALADVMDPWEDWEDAVALKALCDYRHAGGNDQDPAAFEKFLQTWDG